MSKISLKNPPLVELVLGVQFATNLITSDNVFSYYSSFLKDSYPTVTEKPVLPVTIEKPDRPTRMKIVADGGSTRKMFVNKDDDKVIQIQGDRFLLNWRSGKSHKVYPHFDQVFSEFNQQLDNLYKINAQLSNAINQYEITYVDHIVGDSVLDQKYNLKDIFTFISLPNPVKALDLTICIPQIKIDGNLTVIARSGVRHGDNKPVIVLETTCRGFNPDLRFSNWFATGREILVDFFSQATTKELQRKWETI